jgi:hypothetical protein
MAIVDLNLYIRDPESGEWSKPIFGTGGNKLLEKGRASDEGYKMALTDALSVACKALGIGADVYFAKDKTKYTDGEGTDSSAKPQNDKGRDSRTRAANDRPYNAAPADNGPAPGQQTKLTAPEVQMGTCKHCGKSTPTRVLKANHERCKQYFCDLCTEDYLAWRKKQAEMENNHEE